MALGLIIAVACLAESVRLFAADEKPSTDPILNSIFPMAGQKGTTVQAEFRGTNLGGAYALWSDAGGISGEITRVEATPAETKKERNTFRALVLLKIASEEKSASCSLRLITPRGISNSLPFEVTREAVMVDSKPHQTPGDASLVRIPAMVSGRISTSGELDYYAVEVNRGQELMFEVQAKKEKARGLGVPPEFQPQLNLYDSGGSWLDSQQNNWLGSGSLDIPLTYRFQKAGRYLVQIGGILGKGSPDYVYVLRIVSGQEHANISARQTTESAQRATLVPTRPRSPISPTWPPWPAWEERSFTRPIVPGWSEALRSRAVEGLSADRPGSETTDAGQGSIQSRTAHNVSANQSQPAASASITEITETEPNDKPDQAVAMPVPAIITGTIRSPGDVDTFRFNAGKGQRLAFEVETPDVAPPRFNPEISILDADGREIVSNVRKRIYTLRREAPSMTVPAFFDGVEPKVIATFAAAGNYYVQIRGLTFRAGGPHCAYRLMVREQVPHVGDTTLKEDHINLQQGEAKALTITADLEESFDGELALTAEGLPQGVRASPSTEPLAKAPDGYETEHKENLEPQSRKVTLVLAALPGAPATVKPSLIRIQGTPVVNGRVGHPFTIAEVPLMVVMPPQTKTSGLVAGNSAP